MKESAHKTLVLAVSIIVSIMLISGCEEEEKLTETIPDTPPDIKRSRLIAVENAQLKQQIEKLTVLHASQMERQKNLHAKEKDRLQQLLDKCLREKGALEEISRKGIEDYLQNILGSISDENAKLQKENKALKEQIEKLK